MPAKLDLKKDLKHLYNPSAKAPVTIDVPPMHFLMIDGQGDPNTAPAYVAALEALYAAAYTLKFSIKKADGIDYPVMPLEGLWWSADMSDFTSGRRDDWRWTMMIMLPDFVKPAQVKAAIAAAQARKHLPALAHVRFECYAEGLAAQIMYTGPYKDEGPTIQRVHAYITAQGYHLSGKHHEIYLGDPRRTAPARLKTVIRQPMRKP